jgi:two-component sensor histidine kinase
MCPQKGGTGQDRNEGEKGVGIMNVRHLPQGSPEMGRSLTRALRHTGISLIYQDLELRVLWAQNVPSSWTEHDIVGKTDPEFLPGAEAERVVAVKNAVSQSGEPASVEISVNSGKNLCWYEIAVDADRAADGTVSGLITTAIDITDRRRREQTLRALLREVSHRSKNLLAIIQSIATQTGRYSDTIDGFLARFRGRLQSLASSQDLVTSSNWRGADLRELVVGQVGRYVPNPTGHLRIDGINPYLNPNAALHVGLALHELAVNSVSYGALSKAHGVVAIVAEKGGDGSFSLYWREAVPPVGSRASKKRFGSVALERVVPASLNGSATLSIGNGELEYRLTVPAGNFDLEP